MSDDRFKDEPGRAIVDAMQVELSHADLEDDVDNADTRFGGACRDYDMADEAWVSALYAAGGVYRDVPKDITAARFKAVAKKRGAVFLSRSEFARIERAQLAIRKIQDEPAIDTSDTSLTGRLRSAHIRASRDGRNQGYA